MLTYILIIAILFCVFQIILQSYKMNQIGKRYKEVKQQQDKEK